MAQSASAAEPERVALLLPGCELPGVDRAELRRALTLDLLQEGLALAPPGELSPERDLELRLEADCAAPDLLTLRLERGGERRSRTFRLSELAPEQRPRAISLALSEFVSLALRPSPPEPQPLTDEPSPPPPAETTPQPAQPLPNEPGAQRPPVAAPATTPTALPPPDALTRDDQAPRAPAAKLWRLGLTPCVQLFEGTTLWGGELELEWARLRAGAGLSMARESVPSGVVWTRLVRVHAGYSFPLLSNSNGSLLESGPRLGLGQTFMSVEARGSTSGHDARDWYVDAAWTARYSISAAQWLRLGLSLEAGYARGPIGYAGDVRIAQTAGTFATLALGVSLPL